MPATGGTLIYRFYNKKNGSHFYTASENERAAVMARWRGTGVLGPTVVRTLAC